jgi:hypothetical protein
MPASPDTINFEHKGIGAVLAHNRLTVPLNQREYAWEDEHVTVLFQDFANAIAQKASYFLGTIVLTSGKDSVPEVSDGQQRLATTTILLAAIRDYFFNKGEKTRASAIETEYLKTTDLVTEQIVPKLRLNVDDNEFFRKRILSSPDSADRTASPIRDSHKKLAKAMDLAKLHIEGLVAPHGEAAKVARLIEWVQFIKDEARVIALTVPDHFNAFVMFETLNDRGLKTSQADLLKNYLLGQCGDDGVTEGQQKWAKMIGVLESLGESDITVTYLRHLLTCLYGHTKEREVYGRVREAINSKQRALEFLDMLAESASDYAALLNPNHKKWNGYGTSTRHHLSTIISTLKVEQIRPLMFAVTRTFKVGEAKEAFRLFVCWSVRFLVVGGRGGFLDTNYAKAAHEVSKGAIKTTKQLADFMKDIVPPEATFEAAFSEARVGKDYLARYYLRALERNRKGEDQPELVPNEEEEEINLEHVLPEHPELNWPDIAPELAEAYFNRIGNMVVMQAKKNSTVGNAAFADKQKLFAQSAYLLTAEVGERPKWTTTEIQQRQKALAKRAVETWPLKI